MRFDHVAIVSGERSAGWAKTMTSEIEAALLAQEIRAFTVDVDDLAHFCQTPLAQQRETIFLTFNNRIVLPWRRPYFSLMLDHPCHRARELQMQKAEDAATGWVDASHVPALEALGFPNRAFFIAHGGPELGPAPTDFASREIDVFFAGALDEPYNFARWQAENVGATPVIGEVIFAAIQLIEEAGMPALPAVMQAMQAQGVPVQALTRNDFMGLVARVLDIAEINRRFAALSALPNDLRVAVASTYLPKALRDKPGLTYLGYIDDFAEIRALMRKSRLILNTTAKFPLGPHERIWFGMAEGAVLLTDRSRFMEAQGFLHRDSIIYLPQRSLGPGDLDEAAGLARAPESLARIETRARDLYRNRHRWRDRASLLIEAMDATLAS